MAHGKIAGFGRPLAESELVINTALNVDREYGAELENNEYRAAEEEYIEKMLERNVEDGRGMSVQLNPAGYILGIEIATGRDEIGDIHMNAIQSVIEMLVEEDSDRDAFDGFAMPGGPMRRAYNLTDEFRYAIRAE